MDKNTKKTANKIILTGDRPTGRLHVGHYVGSLAERVKLQNGGDFDDMIAGVRSFDVDDDMPGCRPHNSIPKNRVA